MRHFLRKPPDQHFLCLLQGLPSQAHQDLEVLQVRAELLAGRGQGQGKQETRRPGEMGGRPGPSGLALGKGVPASSLSEGT